MSGLGLVSRVSPDILPLKITQLVQALIERLEGLFRRDRGPGHQNADPRHLSRWPNWLLRTRTERSSRSTAEKANEFTSPHCRTQAQGPALYRVKRVL